MLEANILQLETEEVTILDSAFNWKRQAVEMMPIFRMYQFSNWQIL